MAYAACVLTGLIFGITFGYQSAIKDVWKQMHSRFDALEKRIFIAKQNAAKKVG